MGSDLTNDFLATSATADSENIPETQVSIFAEPTMDRGTGADPGFAASFESNIKRGGYNFDFRAGPPDPSANIDPESSVSGSNFMPHWRFVQSSNTNITAKQVRDTASPSGSNLRFTFVSGNASDEAFMEQIVYVGGDREGLMGDALRFGTISSVNSKFVALVDAQYLTVDYANTGNSQSDSVTTATGFLSVGVFGCNNHRNAPTNARWLRVRLRVKRSALATDTGSVDFIDGRHWNYHAFGNWYADQTSSTNGPALVGMAAGSIRSEADPFGTDRISQMDIRAVITSVGSLAAAAGSSVTVTWPSPYADANYTATVSASNNANTVANYRAQIKVKAASTLTVRAQNDDAGAQTCSIHAIAVHD